MTPEYLSDLIAAQGPRAGALKDHIHAFAASLGDRGYAEFTSMQQVRLVAEFGRWLDRKGVLVADLDERRVAGFLAHRRQCGRAARSHRTTLRILLSVLRDAGVTRPMVAVDEKSCHPDHPNRAGIYSAS